MKAKKLLAAIMAVAMIASMMGVGVYASDTADVWDGTVDTSWYNPDDVKTEYALTTAAQLAGLAELVNGGTDSFAGKTVTLNADIDLDQVDWTSIGTSSNPFLGTFDGGEKTISNLWGAANANGLFGYTSSGNRADNYGSEAVIKNFTINGAVITDNEQIHNGAGAVVGCGNMYTTIKNVNVAGEIIVTGQRAGGILGYAYSGAVLDDCHVDGACENMNSRIDALYWACGGIMGFGGPEGTVEITNCSVKNVNINAVVYYGAAGILGNGGSGKVENVSVENVSITAAMEPEYNSYLSGGPAVTGDNFVFNVGLTVGGESVEPSEDFATPVAKSGNKYFESLSAAINEAEEELTLLTDVEISEALEIKKAVTIDLNGNTIDMTAEPNTAGFYPEIRRCTYYINGAVTFKNGTINVASSEAYAQNGVFFVELRDSLTFDNVELNCDGFNAFAFIQCFSEVNYINGTSVNVKNDGGGVFMYSEEKLATIAIEDSEIILDNIENGIVNSKVTTDSAEITMTNLAGSGLWYVNATIAGTEFAVDGAGYGIRSGNIEVENSTITVKNTVNEDGNAGIYIDSYTADGKTFTADETSSIISSLYVAEVEENEEPEIFYLLIFANDEFPIVLELKDTEIDLSEYVPELEGYTFGGWYTDAECTNANKVASVVLDENKTLYAKWVEKRTGGNGGGGLQAGGDTSRNGADDYAQSDKEDDKEDGNEEDNDKTEEQTPVTPVTPAAHPFADVNESHWFDDAVEYVYTNGLMNGTSANTFSPNGELTRAMLVTILYRVEGSPEVSGTASFDDVASGSYYEKAVIWAKENGIVNGYTEAMFCPDVSILREQIAAILYRYASYKGYDVTAGETADILSYIDCEAISEYAVEAMRYAVGSGLLSGKTATTLNSQDNATRAEMATMLQRFIEAHK